VDADTTPLPPGSDVRQAQIWVTMLPNFTVMLQTNMPGQDWVRVDGESRATIGHGFTVHDYSPPLGRYYWYEAGPLTSIPVRVAATHPRLFDMTTGASVELTVRTQRPVTWEGRSSHFDVLQSIPVVVVVPAMPSNAALVLRVAVNDRVPLHRLLKTGRVLVLRSPCSDAVFDTTLMVKNWKMDSEKESDAQGFVTVTVEYQSVHEDIQPTQHLPDWMMLSLPQTYPSFEAMRNAYPTFDALKKGPQ
jgi:hypothetical protein